MADKFTRLGAVQGDVLHATTAGGAKSIESMEDNIDNALMTYLGSDLTQGSTSSASESIIGSVTISADSVRTGIIIMASVKFTPGAGLDRQGSFKIRVGTDASVPTNNTQISGTLTIGSATANGSNIQVGGSLMGYDASQTWTGTVYVQITGNVSSTGSGVACYCENLVVMGI